VSGFFLYNHVLFWENNPARLKVASGKAFRLHQPKRFRPAE